MIAGIGQRIRVRIKASPKAFELMVLVEMVDNGFDGRIPTSATV